MDAKQIERTARWRAKPKGKYARHKSRAKAAGVPFLLTFKQWCCIWFTSGHWHERGDRPGQYVMARKGDRGAYECGNVFITTNEANRQEGYRTVWAPDGPRRCHTKRSTAVVFDAFDDAPGDDVPF